MDDDDKEKRRNVKGLHARFLRENPKFINAPICNINYSTDGNATALECMKWNNSSDDNITPGNDKKECEKIKRVRFAHTDITSPQTFPVFHKAPQTTLDKILSEDKQVKTKEFISYKHQYNCRINPNEPLRGRLHGSFVWDIS